jgi:hypothetical protein
MAGKGRALKDDDWSYLQESIPNLNMSTRSTIENKYQWMTKEELQDEIRKNGGTFLKSDCKADLIKKLVLSTRYKKKSSRKSTINTSQLEDALMQLSLRGGNSQQTRSTKSSASIVSRKC